MEIPHPNTTQIQSLLTSTGRLHQPVIFVSAAAVLHSALAILTRT